VSASRLSEARRNVGDRSGQIIGRIGLDALQPVSSRYPAYRAALVGGRAIGRTSFTISSVNASRSWA
jgi:hypothetical protein